MRHWTTFRAGSALFTLPNLTFWKSVWSPATYELSSSSEFISQSCITSMNWSMHMAWHRLKHYWQFNWWVALVSLGMSVDIMGAISNCRDSINIHVMKHLIFNTWDMLLSSIFCNIAWKWISNIFQSGVLTYLRCVRIVTWFLLDIFLHFSTVKEF